MILEIYSIRDEASGLYVGIQTDQTELTAIRNFDYALSSNELMRFRAEDYSLWRVGRWDNQTGVLDACDPVIVKRGVKSGKR